jgi:hypothetical protein
MSDNGKAPPIDAWIAVVPLSHDTAINNARIKKQQDRNIYRI